MKKEVIKYHRDGSVSAVGNELDGVPDGYWEWFRIDGTKKRSGHFDKGVPVGEWITYDRKGNVYIDWDLQSCQREIGQGPLSASNEPWQHMTMLAINLVKHGPLTVWA